MTLAQFLTACLADLEQSVLRMDCTCPDHSRRDARCPDFILADIAAKRAVIELHGPALGWAGVGEPDEAYCNTCGDYAEGTADMLPCATLRHLALLFVDRPGYREEWRP